MAGHCQETPLRPLLYVRPLGRQDDAMPRTPAECGALVRLRPSVARALYPRVKAIVCKISSRASAGEEPNRIVSDRGGSGCQTELSAGEVTGARTELQALWSETASAAWRRRIPR
jgi:hypothetical protein